MQRASRRLGAFFILFLLCASPLFAAEKEQQAANAVVSRVTTGVIAPEGEFIGTVYYPEVSDVSTEVNGTVEAIMIEEGARVKKGAVLVKLDSKLREKTLHAKVALYEQTFADLERARRDLARTATLYNKKIVAEKEYDDQRYRVQGLEKKLASLKAEVDRLKIELEKTNITSPFSGVVLKRHIARGEWISPGRPVATVARDNVVDIIVEVPADIIRYLKVGMDVAVLAAGHNLKGQLNAIIPRGDISTRTFPVKIRIKQSMSLLGEMEARVKLPRGEKISTLLVPRDAILNMSGKTVVVAVIDSKATMIPTKVTAYTKTSAAINSKNITEGMIVVVKGNERLREGQPVNILKEVE